MPARVRLYVAAVTAVALLLLPLSRSTGGAINGPVAVLAAVILAALIAGALQRPVDGGPKRKVKVSVAAAPEVAAVLLLPGPLAVLTLAAGILAGEARGRARLIQRLFNTAVSVLRATVGTAVYAAMLRRGPALVAEPAATLAAATAMYASTTVLVRGIAAVQLRQNPLRRTWLPSRDMLVAESALSLCGIMAALAAAHHPWVLPLLVVPALVVHRWLRDEARFRALVENSSDIVVVLDKGGVLRYVSPSVKRLLGYDAAQQIGTSAYSLMHPADVRRFQEGFARVLGRPEDHAPTEFRLRHADGSWRYLEATATNLLHDPSVRGVVENVRDITERKLLEEQLAHQAFYDALTGLPNRTLFMDRLGHALARAARRTTRTAVLFLDVDGFKLINDSLGHGVGDHMLVTVGQRLITSLRPGDTVARFGGDEFTVLLEDIAEPGDALRVAERIIDGLRQPFSVEGRDIFITASIGITLSTARDTPARAGDLVREADIALYQAKAAGKARAVLFAPSMNTSAVERLDLATELRQAVARRELRVYYQPEVDLDTGAVVGMEALLRWQHPRHGLVGPADFIPLAEETGLIIPVGGWVLEEACRQARLWQALRPADPPLVVSVNLSARQLQQPDLVEQATRVLRETGLAPSALQLEITESAMMLDTESTIATLRALKEMGVRLAIDDFGTGYSSLSYLQRFPVDTLKIDRSFIKEVSCDPGAAAIVRAVTTLAHALGIEVTAEGIETEEQLARVRALRCDRGQGYYFSEPLPSDALFACAATAKVRAGAEAGRATPA